MEIYALRKRGWTISEISVGSEYEADRQQAPVLVDWLVARGLGEYGDLLSRDA